MKQFYIAYKFIFLLALSFLISCQADQDEQDFSPDLESINSPLVAFVKNSSSKKNLLSSKQFSKTLEYAKIPHRFITAKEYNSAEKIPTQLRVLVFFKTEFFSEKAIKKTIAFIENGGTVVFATLDNSKLLKYLSGIKKEGELTYNTSALGYHFKTNFLPNLKGKKTNNKQTHVGFTRTSFNDNIAVLATAFNDDNYPVIVENKLSTGNVILFNKYGELEKQDRGLLFAAILSGLENIAYPIANVATIALDDFPAPLYPILSEPIKTEMGITQKQYYNKIWWPDMLALADKYKLDYSAYVCFDYRNKTEPPFLFSEWELSYSEKNGIKKYTSDILMESFKSNRHELALHGYNHQSLVKTDWPNQKYMELGLKTAKKRWKGSRYGKLPVTYVPPSNTIDSIGLQALEDAFKSIKYNCSLYLGNFKEGGDREFAVEPYNDHFYNFPRISSGYVMDGDEQFNAQSLFLYTGIWNHFIHPDDVYQIKSEDGIAAAGNYEYRNKENYGWKISKDGSPGLLPRFENYLKEIQGVFPLLDFVTVHQGAMNTQDWQKQSYNREICKDFHLVSNVEVSENDQYWFNYVKKKNTAKTEHFLKNNNLQFSKTPFLEGFLFQIKTPNSQLKLPPRQLKRSKKPNLYKEYLVFKSKDPYSQETTYNTLTQKYLAEGNVPLAIYHLKQTLKAKKASKKELLDLYIYLGWQGKSPEIWETLQNQLQNFGTSKELINISISISEKEGFSSKEVAKVWLPLQLNKYPTNILLQLTYLANFGVYYKDNPISILSITDLLKDSSKQEKTKNLLDDLSYNFPSVFLDLIKDLSPCAKSYSFLAENITWLYADKEEYTKAVAWSKCTTIDQKNIENWRIQTGEFDFLKETNYPKYVEYLLYSKPRQALRELINKKPCSLQLSPSLQQDIAYAYAETGTHRKALEWSHCKEDFYVIDQLIWYQELGNIEAIELVIKSMEDSNPDKTKANVMLIDYYLGEGDMVNAWKWVNDLPDSPTKLKYQQLLNKDVIYASTKNQKFLLKNYPNLFYPQVAKKIKREVIKNENDFIETTSVLVADRLEPTTLGNKVAYGFRDKNLNTHKIGVTQFNAYHLKTNHPEDINHYLYGAEYSFKRKERESKINYSGSLGAQIDQKSDVFVMASANVSYAKDSLYSSAQLLVQPAITGPAYSLNIYQTQLNIYQELTLNKNYTGIVNLETNYYSDGVLDATLTGKFSKSFLWQKSHSFTPYSEISGTLGNTNREDGYPYWSTKERLFGGLGLTYTLKNETTGIELNLDATAFIDTYSDSFQRYIGNLKLPVTSRFYINANAEFYTLENFYSNNFNLGLKYYLDKN